MDRGSRSGVKAGSQGTGGLWLRGCGFGAGGSELWTFMQVKGVLMQEIIFFLLLRTNYPYGERRGSRDLDTDDSVGGLWSLADPSWLLSHAW